MSSHTMPVVLIVDDLKENIEIAASILGTEDYEVLSAMSGPAALEIVSFRDVDLILLDVLMPEMTGFEACHRLKENRATRDIPVIFLTALSDTESLVEGFEAGAVDYVTKPFNVAELLARVRTHLRLRRTEHELRRALIVKDRVLHIVANQLNSPFAGLHGMLKTINAQPTELNPEELTEYLGMAEQAADMIADILDNLLSWARLQTGILPVHPRVVPLERLFAERLLIQEADLDEKSLQVDLDVEPGLTISADPEMMERVFDNLLANAVKYNKIGGSITISAKSDGSEAYIIIEDSGVGIPAKELEGLLHLESQHVREGVAGEMGGGMGLILSRALLEENDGIIALESEEGMGTRVHVRLPRPRVA